MNPKQITEEFLLDLVKKRYDPQEYLFLEKVSNGPGSRQTRIADALALNRWATRGLVIHCIEVKCTRQDWLREKRKPSKAEGVGVYCDFFWLVAGRRGVVQDDELPIGWGLLELTDNQKLRKVIDAKKGNYIVD